MKKELVRGTFIQIYRGAMTQEQKKNLGTTLDKFKELGVVGTVWHGFTGEMSPAVFKPLAKLCSDRGMLALAAYGLDATDPIGKATRMAAVANMPECYALVLDQEGAWEIKEGKARAKQMGDKLRELCPDVLIIDQAWMRPDLHKSFMWIETAQLCDIRAPQFYVNDYPEANRYSLHWPQCVNAWKELNRTVYAPLGLSKKEIVTVQGYRWVLKDLVHCLINNDTRIVWAEPYPDADFMKGLEIVKKLKDLGFEGPEAVKNFQLSTNGQLVADGVCGPLTVALLLNK